MSSLPVTPSQTVGPFFSPCLLRDDLSIVAGPDAAGERIRIEGHVYDGLRAPVPDAVIEIWHANAHGRYNHPLDTRELPLDPACTGFGRCGTDDGGRFAFETAKPGPVPLSWGPRMAPQPPLDGVTPRYPDADMTMQAPHICVTVLARGLLNHLSTRLYFDDDPATAGDPILLSVPEELRATLLARRQRDDGIAIYRFDIVLQGQGETVFFDL